MNRKIISYNVNGLRAALNKRFIDWVQSENPDILCLQETKLQEGQIDTSVFEKLGYYNFWHHARKKGYSGISLLTKQKPFNVNYGIGIEKYDQEGRTIIADFDNFILIPVYFPSGTTGDVRQEFKMHWLNDFLIFIYNL